jgi:glycine/D-amino acid oxidase-like deaminating enzyme
MQQRRVVDIEAEMRRVGAWACVNCAGMGNRSLTQDASLAGARGATVKVKAPHVKRFVVDLSSPNLTYVLPRGCGTGECVLGGSHEDAVDDTAIRPQETKAIIARCHSLCNELGPIQPAHGVPWVGLRPERPVVRVERDPVIAGLIHNYGHGGSGFTLHWGCAQLALRLVSQSRARALRARL